jgi:hypothetical protein
LECPPVKWLNFLGRATPASPRAVLHHTDANLCTILHTTVTRELCSK